MPNPFQRILYASLIPAPFVLGMWTVLAWIVFQRSVPGFLSLFLTIPASFIQLAILGVLLWLRESIRMKKAFTTEDVAWYLGTFGLWAVGAALPDPIGGLVQLAGFAAGILAMGRIGRRSREEAVANMTARADYLRQHLDGQAPGPWPDASGPGAGRVITVETGERWEDTGSSARGDVEAVDGEIVDERDDDGPDPDEWEARPRSG
ncbi:hypothetical protein [Gulosibacter sp. 10]|uniref:hypothetical protein n=1 Tax=Gulosibacter sp. 10 TaxID=1255570 RepID=UPI00097E8702|nr:hypothetical protein [Gulosibacter sp. 10]SJM68536.1 hypothetical protein FM112_13435 [Gulosibacter sp. 10]